MVKVAAPMMSLSASGALGGAIVFSRWKGRAYVRSLVTPANPKSAAQTGIRAMLAFLSEEWAGLGASEKASWEDLADATDISPFNAYIQYNMRRWRDFLAPDQLYPAAAGDTLTAVTGEAATALERSIQLDWTAPGDADAWGLAIFRSTSTGFSTNWANLVKVSNLVASGDYSYTDGPLEPGAYYYNFRQIGKDGTLGSEETEVTATVT